MCNAYVTKNAGGCISPHFWYNMIAYPDDVTGKDTIWIIRSP